MGTLEEELIVFGTGSTDGTSTSDDTGRFSASMRALKSILGIRDRTTNFEFVTDSQYRIIDSETGTVLAEQSYDGSGEAQYGAIKLTFDQRPLKEIYSLLMGTRQVWEAMKTQFVLLILRVKMFLVMTKISSRLTFYSYGNLSNKTA